MANETVTLSAVLQMTAKEILAAADLPSANSEADRTWNHNGLNHSDNYSGSSTVSIDQIVPIDIDLTGSPITVDLTNAPKTGGRTAEDHTGLKVIGLLLNAPTGNAGAVSMAPGASNPYPLFGTAKDIEIAPGRVLAFMEQTVGLAAVSSSVKSIDFDGTNGDHIDGLLFLGS